MILAGDIGGTKTNLALYELENNKLKIINSKQFVSANYNSFMDLIKEFKNETSISNIEALCLGIAGPIIDGRCTTTNLPWDIKAKDLKEYFGIKSIHLLNDLEATAYGMLYLDEEEFVNLNPKAKNTKGNIAVIAAGTGLGEAILYFDGNSYHPIATEGGHTDFAPLTSQEDELLLWLRKKYPEHVSYERIVSGIGIYTLYEFLLETKSALEPQVMKDLKDKEDKSARVSKCALEDEDSLCIEALKLFTKIYAAEAGNLALKSMSLGGVYIGGGIAPKILPFIKSEEFLNAFIKKGRFKNLLEKMQIKVSLNDKTALIGAARFAFDKLVKVDK